MDMWNKTNIEMTVSPNTDTSQESGNLQSQVDLSDTILWYFITYVSTTINFILSPLGVTTNAVNIIVYWRLGIKDSVNITFISLSVWNLVACFLSWLAEILQAIEKFSPLAHINMLSLQYVCLGFTKGFTYVTITFITVYLTVERSICIIFPFKVKEIFNARSITVVNFAAVMFGLVCFCPGWATQGMQWVVDPSTNKTRLDLWVSDNRRDVELFIDAVGGMALPVLAQILISVFTGFMLREIKKSTKFRQKHAKQEESGRVLNGKDEISAFRNRSNQIKGSMTMTSKDMKLTKVVILLAMIFFVCNSPVFIASFLRAFMSEIRVNKGHNKLHTFLYSLVFQFGVINSTMNILVYYNVSSRYRQEFILLFSRCGFVRNGNS